MTPERLFLTRTLMMGAAGMICLIYAVLALLTGRPDPIPVWTTGVAGVLAWLVIWRSAIAAPPGVAGQTFDEGYRAEALRAQAFAFWVAIWMYPLFGLLVWLGWVSWPVAFASMGCLTAASYLLRAIWLDLQGRKAC